MPKRKNAFQSLFHLIYRQLAGNATVTESRMFKDKVTDEEREVDIAIESVVAGHNCTLSVECIFHKRKASTKWVEEMRAKHEALPTNKLILVSHSGFSKPAVKKAEFNNIETIGLGKAAHADWTEIIGKETSLILEYYNNKVTYRLFVNAQHSQC